jgi:flavin reductase (DIM6/NTAB) family NADH-FMN oxidoreductase RutF
MLSREVLVMEPHVARALAALTNGIHVLTIADQTHRHGMAASWVTQVSGDPPLLMASVDQHHFSHSVIGQTGVFGLNVIGRRARQLEEYFCAPSARGPDNLQGLVYELSPKLGVPWLGLAMICIEARVRETVVAGDHTLFVAEIAGIQVNANDRPLTSLDLDYVYLGAGVTYKHDRTGWD